MKIPSIKTQRQAKLVSAVIIGACFVYGQTSLWRLNRQIEKSYQEMLRNEQDLVVSLTELDNTLRSQM